MKDTDKEVLTECLAKLFFAEKCKCNEENTDYMRCYSCPAPCGIGHEMREAARILHEYVLEGNLIHNVNSKAFI